MRDVGFLLRVVSECSVQFPSFKSIVSYEATLQSAVYSLVPQRPRPVPQPLLQAEHSRDKD